MAQPSRWLAGVLLAGVATAAACGDDSGSGGSGGEGGDTTSTTTSTTKSSSATTGSTSSSSGSSTNTTATTSTGMGGEAEGGGGSGQGGEGGEGGGGQMVACIDVTDPMLECDAPDAAACACWGCTLPTCSDDMGFNDCVCSTCADDPFCSDPTNCNNDGICDPFNEGCVCADCYAHPACAGQVENCTNGVDDNGDTEVDCADVEYCGSNPACAEDCDNAVDDNGNGDVDCADAFCAGDPACASASCTTATPIMLGVTTGDTTTGGTGLDSSCQNGGALEKVYTFTPAASGFLRMVLEPDMADLGVYVRTTCSDDTTEVDCSDAVGNDTLIVPVTSGTPISIIVDGYEAGEAGTFTLTLTAIPSTWVCNPGYYQADDGCDCGCGVVDPDCADATVGECEYCEAASCANDGTTFGCDDTLINPTNNAVCLP